MEVFLFKLNSIHPPTALLLHRDLTYVGHSKQSKAYLSYVENYTTFELTPQNYAEPVHMVSELQKIIPNVSTTFLQSYFSDVVPREVFIIVHLHFKLRTLLLLYDGADESRTLYIYA